jgi:hypothetical protein
VLVRRIRSTEDLLEAARICRALVLSDLEGAGAFLLFALYFEYLERLREGTEIDADKYEELVSELLPHIYSCLEAIEKFDTPGLLANINSFSRTAVRMKLT